MKSMKTMGECPPRGGRPVMCSHLCEHTGLAVCCGNCDADGCDLRCYSTKRPGGCELRVRP